MIHNILKYIEIVAIYIGGTLTAVAIAGKCIQIIHIKPVLLEGITAICIWWFFAALIIKILSYIISNDK